MNKHLLSFATCAGLLLIAPASVAAVEYVRICTLYGAGFHYVPGTDTCTNTTTGDTRQQTEGGTWRSLVPYPEGKWVTTPPLLECLPGRTVTLGTFSSNDFFLNAWQRMQTRTVPVPVNRGEFVSKVIMSGGFSDPRLLNRRGTNGMDGLCVRSVDPTEVQNIGNGSISPPFGNGMLPIGCVANSRILNMPAAYAVSATAAYPNIDSFYIVDGNQSFVSGPYTYGTGLVVTTDFGSPSFQRLIYNDARVAASRPLAGSVTVSVCIQPGVAR
ncbi:porin [Ramlibacter sp. WS9]|uniref:porin n=1 Tax=Ramlibacter sp. WS9 TaxID=1882741 RepID=UPI001141A808|nr:porin [Ramlibacter sp. WS9]ROZ78354.1 hypothetical protein EEB15_07935 [Ramlibacter sp. WS9]